MMLRGASVFSFSVREPQRRLDGIAGAALTFALGRGRVLAQAHARVQLGRRLAGRSKFERGSGAERHPSLFGSDAVLKNPGPLAATAQAQAEARNVVVERDHIGLSGRQREAVDRGLGQFHRVQSDSGKPMGKSVRRFLASSCNH
jgi:hypothetical protein